jgi:hypothetical protein
VELVSAIEQIRERLARYPAVRVELTGGDRPHALTVLPAGPEGFEVSIIESPGHWTVAYEGWHEEFDSERSALDCFAFGLSAACRLRVEYRGAAAVKWTLEVRSGGGWVEESTVGLFHPFFWRRRRVRYLQNDLVPAAGLPDGVEPDT